MSQSPLFFSFLSSFNVSLSEVWYLLKPSFPSFLLLSVGIPIRIILFKQICFPFPPLLSLIFAFTGPSTFAADSYSSPPIFSFLPTQTDLATTPSLFITLIFALQLLPFSQPGPYISTPFSFSPANLNRSIYHSFPFLLHFCLFISYLLPSKPSFSCTSFFSAPPTHRIWKSASADPPDSTAEISATVIRARKGSSWSLLTSGCPESGEGNGEELWSAACTLGRGTEGLEIKEMEWGW